MLPLCISSFASLHEYPCIESLQTLQSTIKNRTNCTLLLCFRYHCSQLYRHPDQDESCHIESTWTAYVRLYIPPHLFKPLPIQKSVFGNRFVPCFSTGNGHSMEAEMDSVEYSGLRQYLLSQGTRNSRVRREVQYFSIVACAV